MLPKEAINNPESLDDIFVEMRKAYEQRKVPMNNDQSGFSISIMMADDNAINKMYDDFSEHFEFAALFRRSISFPIKYEKRLLIWIGVISIDFGIGGILLVAYYLQWWAYRHRSLENAMGRNWGESSLTLSEVCEYCFPFGVFNKETIHEFWEKQKVDARPDNLIDHHGASASFMKPIKN